MDVALKGPKTGRDQDAVFVCAVGFAFGDRVVGRGSKLRHDDPLIHSHPQFFVPDGTPTNEWPHPLDQVIRENDERGAREAAEAEAAFADECRANKVRLAPRLYRASHDIFCTRDNRPTLVLKGSVVADDDPLVHAQPESWEELR